MMLTSICIKIAKRIIYLPNATGLIPDEFHPVINEGPHILMTFLDTAGSCSKSVYLGSRNDTICVNEVMDPLEVTA